MRTGVDRRVGGLLERLGNASDFEECCAAVLHHLLGSSPDAKGLILARAGGRVKVFGWRVGSEAVQEAETAGRTNGSALARVLAGEDPASFSDRVGDLDPWLVVPLAPGGSGGRGVLLADGLETEEAAAVESVLDRCSPVLLRALELETLRGRVEALEREGTFRNRMLEAIPDPVLMTDGHGNIVTTNQRAQELFFTEPDAGEGRIRAVRLNTFLLSTRLTEEGIPGLGGTRRELNLVDPRDGSDLLFEMRTDQLRREGHGEGHVISVLREVTEVKRATEELQLEFRRSRAAEHRARQEWSRLHAILENVAEPILVTDIRSEIVLMNREAERLFEVEPARSGPEERAPVRWTNVARLSSFVSDLLLSREPRSMETLALVDPSAGEEFPVEATGVKLEDERGETTAIVTVLRDLTPVAENERLARELQALNEDLENRIEEATRELEERNRLLEWQSRELAKASRLKSQFLANMSHELRTPLNAMLGYISLMQEQIFGPLTDAQEGALGKVEAASEHLLELINDILDLSKIEAGKMEIRLEEVEVATLVSELTSTIEPLIGARPIQLRIEAPGDSPPLRTDRTKLRQVLLNLLENAVKFTKQGSVTLRVRPHRDGERFRIEVEDTGVGMADHELEHVFDDFRQADESRTREHGGAGLGLSISRRLVSLLGGSISVQSVLGRGSRFTVDLPSLQEPPSTELAARSALLGHPSPPAVGRTSEAAGVSGPRDDDDGSSLYSDISHGLKNPLQGIVGYVELMEMGRFGELEPQLRDVVEKVVSHGRHMSGRLDVAMGLLGLAAEAAREPTWQATNLGEAAKHAARRLADEAAEKGAELEVALGDRVSHVFGTPDRLATLVLALLRLALNGADPGLLRLRAENAGAETIRLYVEADGAEAETERMDPPGDPLEGERMERAILGLLVEGLGGRVDWACPETNGRGPAVYLQAAGEDR